MIGERVITLPTRSPVASLGWAGDALVDVCAGWAVYHLDGTTESSRINYAFPFDAALVSPSGVYAIIYQRLGTKGLVLRRGEVVREIDRSFYHAHVYEYPAALTTLPDGREALIHCPEHYNQLEIENPESGRRLTPQVERELCDFFHSRLALSPSGKWLISAGWMWHPFDTVGVYPFVRALQDARVLDQRHGGFIDGVEVQSAQFLAEDRLAVWSAADAENFAERETRNPSWLQMSTGSLGVYDLATDQFLSVARVDADVGAMMPVGPDHVIGFHDQPKLIHVPSGRVVRRWPEIASGQQKGSIIHHLGKLPPIATDPSRRRFAVGGAQSITVVQLPELLPTISEA